MPSIWAPEEGESSPGKYTGLGRSLTFRVLDTQSCQGGLTGATALGQDPLCSAFRILVEISQVTQGPYPVDTD